MQVLSHFYHHFHKQKQIQILEQEKCREVYNTSEDWETMTIPTTTLNDTEQICSTNLCFVLISTINDKASRQRQVSGDSSNNNNNNNNHNSSTDDNLRYNERMTTDYDYDLDDITTTIWWPCYKCVTLSQIDTIVQCKSLYSSVNSNRIRAKALLDFFDTINSSLSSASSSVLLDVQTTCTTGSIPPMYILLGDTTPNNQRLVFEDTNNNNTNIKSKKRSISSTSNIGTVLPMNNETLGRLLIQYTVRIRQDISLKLAWCALKNIMEIAFQNDTKTKIKESPPTSSTYNTNDNVMHTDTSVSPQCDDTVDTAQTGNKSKNDNDTEVHDINTSSMLESNINVIDVQSSSKGIEQKTITIQTSPPNTTTTSTTIVTNSEESVADTINDPSIHSDKCEENNAITATTINDDKESDTNTSRTVESSEVQSNAASEQNTINTPTNAPNTTIVTTSEELVAVDINDASVHSDGNNVTVTADISNACMDSVGIDSSNLFDTVNENSTAATISTTDLTELQHPISNQTLDQLLAVDSTDRQDSDSTSLNLVHTHQQQTDCTSVDTAVDTNHDDKNTKQKHYDILLQDILAVHKELMFEVPSTLDEIKETNEFDDETKLNQCLNRLGEVTRPTFAIDTTNSTYSQKILSVTLFLHDSFTRGCSEKCTYNNNKNNNNYQSNAIFVCGMPGIGKTLGVQMSCLAIQRYWKNHHPDEKEPIIYIVNAASLANQRNPYDTIVQNIYKQLGLHTETQRTEKQLLKFLQKQKQNFILVIDEIDALVSGKVKTKDALRKLLNIANNNNINTQQKQQLSSKIAIIGISNCVNNIDHQKVLSVGNFNEPIFFHPYSESEIVLILQARIGDDISLFDKPVLKRIANHVAKKSGDIRLALELVAEAIKLCLHDSPKNNNDNKSNNNNIASKIIVNMKHACKAIDSMEMINVDHIRRTIRSRTPVENTTLAILLMIGKEHSKTINFVVLQNYIRTVIRKTLTDNLANSFNLQSVVTALVDSGLLVASINKKKNNGSSGATTSSSSSTNGGDNNSTCNKMTTNDTIKLDLQIQEVIQCFCTEHEQSSHFQKILEDATIDRDTF